MKSNAAVQPATISAAKATPKVTPVKPAPLPEKVNKEKIDPIDFPLGGNALTCRVRCNSCIHFTGIPAPGLRKPCINLGVLDDRIPCSMYTTSPSKVLLATDRNMRYFADIIKHLPKGVLPKLAALLNQESRTRRYGFTFGQKVYFRLPTDDFLSNYRKAYVAFADSRYVYLSGEQHSVNYNCYLLHGSIYTIEQWRAIKATLIKQGKIQDPKLAGYYTPRVPPKADYEPPTIDHAASKSTKHGGRVNKAITGIRQADTAHQLPPRAPGSRIILR